MFLYFMGDFGIKQGKTIMERHLVAPNWLEKLFLSFPGATTKTYVFIYSLHNLFSNDFGYKTDYLTPN